jgi:phosphoglycerol transferase MdoB-like AlkP superfamily enzyme
VRTEFAFLCGIGENELGVHRFNPYRAIAAGWKVLSLASCLKRLGYRTVCIHPFPASFYRRDRVYPRLGFDEFLDIRAFGGAAQFGPYIGDAAVTDRIETALRGACGPTFLFAITMENHGPLHLERVVPPDIGELYARSPPVGCDDLTIYLRHLRNADRMISRLRQMLERCERPASLCWYGDHVPIMPAVYETFGAPQGEVDYVLWDNRRAERAKEREIHAHDLALNWLRLAGVAPGGPSSGCPCVFSTRSEP